ncbi:HAMP domain-containing histidine kinase C-terminal domain protein [Candidatus Cyrtobacter comes]|uniref:histidine kinase n=1 Tax=Candidatus Cyrtobacter comes TaxID=675776 RepID=A0ABU5L913_9RICK|nr:HAMP domain-containing histidine kinase C-terminal domain protein [Candidatus Cyrtobacter comes]
MTIFSIFPFIIFFQLSHNKIYIIYYSICILLFLSFYNSKLKNIFSPYFPVVLPIAQVYFHLLNFSFPYSVITFITLFYVCLIINKNAKNALWSILISFILLLFPRKNFDKELYDMLLHYTIFLNLFYIGFVWCINNKNLDKYAFWLTSTIHDVKNSVLVLRYNNAEIVEKTKDSSLIFKSENTAKNISDVCDTFLALEKDRVFSRFKLKKLLKDIIDQNIKKDNLIKLNINDDIYINTDEIIFKRIIVNLFENAIDAVAKVKNGQILVLAEQIRNKIIIKVRDNGPGIDDINKIFDKGFSTKKSGHGVGLTFVEIAAEKLNISINVDSIPGEYTEFTLTHLI